MAKPRGLLSVVSDPPGLRVEVDGRVVGSTPLRLSPVAGRLVYVTVKPTDPSTHRSVTRAVLVRPRQQQQIELSPRPIRSAPGQEASTSVLDPDPPEAVVSEPAVRPASIRIRCGTDRFAVRIHRPSGLVDELWTPSDWVEIPADQTVRIDVLPPEEDGWIGICRVVQLSPGLRHSFEDLRPIRRATPPAPPLQPVPAEPPVARHPLQQLLSRPALDQFLSRSILAGLGGHIERWALLERHSQELWQAGCGWLPEPYLEAWAALHQPTARGRAEAVIELLMARPPGDPSSPEWGPWLALVEDSQTGGAGFQRWFSPPDTGPYRAGRRWPEQLGALWLRDLLCPYLRLAQYIFEALPMEVPELSVPGGPSGEGLVDRVSEISLLLGYEYDHIALYRARRGDFDYRNNVICHGVSHLAPAAGDLVGPIVGDVVCRVPTPLFIPRDPDMVGDGAVVHVLTPRARPAARGRDSPRTARAVASGEPEGDTDS